jgi:hypothetical protein
MAAAKRRMDVLYCMVKDFDIYEVFDRKRKTLETIDYRQGDRTGVVIDRRE